MARTPQRTFSQDFTVVSGDAITGDDATGGAGGTLVLEGGDAASGTNTDGGNVTLRPGLEDGSGTLGEVGVTNRAGTEDDPILAFTSATGNAHTFRIRTGTVQPNTDSVPASDGGDLYVRSDGSMWIASATGTGNWTQFTSGSLTLEAAVENTGATDANMDQSFDWRITDSDTLEFSNSDGSNPLLTIAPAAAGDTLTLGGTATSSTITAQGPTTGTGFLTVTHGGADTVPLMTWTTSGSGGDSVQVFTGSSSPNTRVTGAIGSLFLDGTAGKAWINTDGSTAWTDLSTGGGVSDLDGAVDAQSGPVTQTDRNIDWRITDTYYLQFADSAGAQLFRVAPASGGNIITAGGTGTGDQVAIQGPSTGAVRPKVTHAGADTVPVLQLESTGTNGEDIRFFVGDQTPNGTISGNPGDLYVKHDGVNSTLNLNIGSGDANTTWVVLGGQWQQETYQTTDATANVTIATPVSSLSSGDQEYVEVLVVAESGASNTYFRRQLVTYYNDGGVSQWTVEESGAEQRRGLTTATAALAVSGSSIVVQATGEALTTINWTVHWRTKASTAEGASGQAGGGGGGVQTVDKRGAGKTTTSSAASGGGTATGSIDLGISTGACVYLKVTANGNTTDSDIEFWRDSGKTDQVYQALIKDAYTAAFEDGTPWSLATASDLGSSSVYYTITNNGANASTYDIEMLCHGE